MKRVFWPVLVSMLVLFGSSFVCAEDYYPDHPTPVNYVEDVLILRPVGIIRTVIEAAAFVVSLPVTIPLKQDEAAYDYLVRDPHIFLFERPLGKN